MENGPHEEAEVVKENEEDDDELPSATSPSEEVEEADEDEEPLLKRQKRKSGESACALSPLKETGVEDKEETSGSSSGATHTSNPEEPLCNARGFPQIRFCLFFFWHHHDISIIASHVLATKIIFIKPYFILLKLS